MDTATREAVASDRSEWTQTGKAGVKTSEQQKVEPWQAKRDGKRQTTASALQFAHYW